MAKQQWKPGNMLYPLPAVMVSVRDNEGKDNIITVAWAGTVCTNPPMVSISVRPERYSYRMIEESGVFLVHPTPKALASATDSRGVPFRKNVDKLQKMKTTCVEASEINCGMIGESPVNIECKVVKIEKLGSHHMFLAQVAVVHADEAYMNENGRFDLNLAHPMVYSHGTYYGVGRELGTFGYSVRKRKTKRKSRK